jgi:hypothetical protein
MPTIKPPISSSLYPLDLFFVPFVVNQLQNNRAIYISQLVLGYILHPKMLCLDKGEIANK